MKTFLLLCIVALFAGKVESQSHTFNKVRECTYENGEWGRWVYFPDDVQVSNEGNGIYRISFFGYNESHADTYFNVNFKDADGTGWYIYEITTLYIQKEFYNIDKFSIAEIKVSEKLSSMASGAIGTMNIWLNNTGVAYSCNKY